MELDDDLKKLVQNLGIAINDALSDSTEIAHAIDTVREAGYEVLLVLEATIGVSRHTDEGARAPAGMDPESGQLRVNAQDKKFLKSLKIRVDDLDSPG